ncbi:hypothetical protein [Nitratidesulfovibrio sp.]|uniref:hypothetical protein n=1 Tax=Nitratidesulfovibrio sp. TaxID=2802297 RepID=UPI0033406ACE
MLVAVAVVLIVCAFWIYHRRRVVNQGNIAEYLKGVSVGRLLRGWKESTDAARGEKQWINERLSWLFLPQAMLMAALATVIAVFSNCDVGRYAGFVFLIIGVGFFQVYWCSFWFFLLLGCMENGEIE